MAQALRTEGRAMRLPPRPAAFALPLALLALVLAAGGVLVGSDGFSFAVLHDPSLREVLWDIRLPRVTGAALTGALLGLGGAIAQGLFRNPLADPYLLGSAAGAGLGVVAVLAAGRWVGAGFELLAADLLSRLGLVGAAFAGALAGVALTVLLARGAQRPMTLLLAGVVVGVVLGAVADLLTLSAPEALRGRQVFMLGTTGFLGWGSCGVLAGALAIALPLAWRYSRALDALALGEDTARSLGLPLARVRLLLVVVLALATGAAVAQTGLIGFVGLVSPHLVRRRVAGAHGALLLASAAMGGVLLMGSDLLARGLAAPQELPVGVLTAIVGGSYLLWLMHRRGAA
jgi:iron complex transport system permease protein